MTARFYGADKSATPKLVKHFNAGGLWALPKTSAAPKSLPEQLQALAAAGISALQHPFPERLPPTHLAIAGMGRIDQPADADRLAAQHKRAGYALTTLHVGSGLETDAEIDRLVSAIIEASTKHDYPLFIETHRATVTQDIRRTLDLVDRLPEVRFNADLSHWYTGHEMAYGDFDAKLDAMTPIFERVRYMHGRIGTPCCAQVALRDADDDRAFVAHARQLWTRAMAGFAKTAEPGEVLPFAPELLPYALPIGETTHYFYYARIFGDEAVEESDRWQQAMVLFQIAEQCAARAGLSSAAHLGEAYGTDARA